MKFILLSATLVAMGATGAWAGHSHHLGNGEVGDHNFTTNDHVSEGDPGGDTVGGSGGGGLTSPPRRPATDLKHAVNYCEDAREFDQSGNGGGPLCAQPPTPPCPQPKCTANTGNEECMPIACIMMEPAPRTYGSCKEMKAANARFLHKGACHPPGTGGLSPREGHKLHMGFMVNNYQECVEKLKVANQLNPVVANWLNGSNTVESYCSNIFGRSEPMPTTVDDDDHGSYGGGGEGGGSGGDGY